MTQMLKAAIGAGRRVVGGALVAALLVSCTAYRPLKVDDLPGGLRDGDRVSITTKDGTVLTFSVAAVGDDAIRGTGKEIGPEGQVGVP